MTSIEQKQIPYNIIFLSWSTIIHCFKENTQRDIPNFNILRNMDGDISTALK